MEAGTVGAGRYRLEQVLGSGGTATVFLAWDTRLGVHRALKMLHADKDRAGMLRGRLEAEARAMARVQHPNILMVHDVGVHDDKLFVVMEYAARGSIGDRLAEGPLPPRMACAAIQAVLEALREAHACGIVHRDVKPQNIVVTEKGTVKLMDFGIASMPDGDAFGMTATGTQLGTLAYMSPEQRVDPRRVDARSDLYAVGATLCVMLTRRNPLDLHASDAHGELLAGIPARLAAIIAKATRYRAADRYPSADAMKQAIATVEAELPPDPPDIESLGAWRRSAAAPPPVAAHTDVSDDSLAGIDASSYGEGPHTWTGTSAPSDAPKRAPEEPDVPEPAPEPVRVEPEADVPLEPAPVEPPPRRRWAPALLALLLVPLAFGAWWTTSGDRTAPGDPPGGAAIEAELPITPPAPPPEALRPEALRPEALRPEPPPPEALPPPGPRIRTRATPAVEPGPPPAATTGGAPPEEPVETGTGAEAPAAVATASIRITGDALAVQLIAGDGTVHPPGPVAPGTYAVRAAFREDPEVDAGRVTVGPGEQLVIRCTDGFMRCTPLSN